MKVKLIPVHQVYLFIDTDHVKPGKGPAYVQAKMKNIETGTIKVNRLNSSDKLEDVTIDRRDMQFLYDSSGHGEGPYVFMDNETYDQHEVPNDVVSGAQNYLLEGMKCDVIFSLAARPNNCRSRLSRYS